MRRRAIAWVGGWLWVLSIKIQRLAGWVDDRAGFPAVLDDMGIRK